MHSGPRFCATYGSRGLNTLLARQSATISDLTPGELALSAMQTHPSQESYVWANLGGVHTPPVRCMKRVAHTFHAVWGQLMSNTKRHFLLSMVLQHVSSSLRKPFWLRMRTRSACDRVIAVLRAGRAFTVYGKTATQCWPRYTTHFQ